MSAFAITRSSGDNDLDAAARSLAHGLDYSLPRADGCTSQPASSMSRQDSAVRSLVGGPFLPPIPSGRRNRSGSVDAPMVRIAISQAAFDAIASDAPARQRRLREQDQRARRKTRAADAER